MKTAILFLTFITATLFSNAQLPWKIKLGNKTILQTTGEDKAKNVAAVKSKKIDSKASLVIIQKIQPDEKEWVRTIMIDDTTGVGIMPNPEAIIIKRTRNEISYTVPVSELRKIVTKHKKIEIWFTSIPSDPAKAAIVRVRKVHIATVDFSQRY